MSEATKRDRTPGAVIASWCCMTLAGAFLAWILGSSLAEVQEPEVGLVRYARLLGPAAIIALALCALLMWTGGGYALAQLSRALTLSYLSVLKVAGLSFAPAAALGLTLAAVLRLRSRSRVSPALSLALHAMGTLGGFYLAANVHKYTIAWPMLRNVVRGVWRLVSD
jgi:hypothetical protein